MSDINIVVKKFDWLAIAIGKCGGLALAALAIGVSQKTLCIWLDRGLADAEFGKVVKLSEKGDVPLEYLARRLEPSREAREYFSRLNAKKAA